MTTAVKTTITALVCIVQVVPIGTNISIVRMLWALMNGSFLQSRGAVHSALSSNEFSEEEVRRSWSALRYGSWEINELLSWWHVHIASSNEWSGRRYNGYRIKSIDTTGFWRPHLKGAVSVHYSSLAQRALPAIVFGVIVTSGVIKEKRIPRLDQIIRCPAEMSAADFNSHLLVCAKKSMLPDEIAVVDAGFGLSALHHTTLTHYVIRMAANCTVRTNELPAYKGRGAPPKFGTLIRPLVRKRLDKTIAASAPEVHGTFKQQKRTIRYHAWHQLVTPTTHVAQDNPCFSLFVFFDPLYSKPMLLATDMTDMTAETVYLIYRDRWPVEHPPLAAKQMIGLHRQFVFNNESCFRLPNWLCSLAMSSLIVRPFCRQHLLDSGTALQKQPLAA